jgi:hypothetical protein
MADYVWDIKTSTRLEKQVGMTRQLCFPFVLCFCLRASLWVLTHYWLQGLQMDNLDSNLCPWCAENYSLFPPSPTNVRTAIRKPVAAA